MRKIILGLLMLLPGFILAQKYTVSGSVKDGSNGEDMIGATIAVLEMPGTGALSNDYGFFSLTLPEGSYTLLVRYVGYEDQEVSVNLNENTKVIIELADDSKVLETVKISARRDNDNVTSSEMGVARMNPKDVESIPVLFGEKDIIKTMQLLPGIKPAGEGNAGFSVRGGGTDQNLILLDEAPVYNASHLLGFFSVFNSDVIKDVTLYKGGMPAEYGGRASSVMDIRMKDGNKKRFGAKGGIGLISSRLAIEAPIVKDKGSFIVSGRRTYADLFLKLSPDTTINNTKLYFYDLNLKANMDLGEKDRVFVSGYFGRDKFGFGDDFGFDWGNTTATVRWNHLFSERMFSNTSVIYSKYDYEFGFGGEDDGFGIKSSIRDWSVKEDLTWFPSSKHTVKAGLSLIYHTFVPGEITRAPGNINIPSVDERYAFEGGVYIQDDFKVSERIGINAGLRYSFFNNVGNGVAYTFDDQGDILTETEYDDWESIQYYGGLEPRMSASYVLNENSSVKFSLNRNFQYVHQLSNTTSASPTDVYVPSSNVVKPQIGNQAAAGYFFNLNHDMFEASVEGYYKILENQIDYRNGANLLLNSSVEGELVFGEGRAFGAEFFFKKRKGRLTGWVSYALSRTLRTFDEIDNGEEFSARFDRIHDLSVTAIYEISEKLTASANFIFYTGDAITYPAGRYEVDGLIVPYYTARNAARLPDYHRLDLGVTWQLKKTEKFESSLNFSLYNAYGRENAFSINFQESETNPGTTEAVQLSLFKYIPSVTYNFEF